jgi:protein SCO1
MNILRSVVRGPWSVAGPARSFARTTDNGQRTKDEGRRAFALLVLLWALAVPVPAQRGGEQHEVGLPAQANPFGLDVSKNVRFDQKLDGQVPVDLPFRDENGAEVRLADYLGKKPVALVLVQYECKMLCTQMLNGTLHALFDLKFDIGKDFDIVTISIDPRETPDLGAAKKKSYLDEFEQKSKRSLDPAGWHFLVGSKESIDGVADAIGYRYHYDSASDQYAHPSGIVVLTPSGKIARYFYGIQYPTTDLRLGLVEASNNKIGSPVDQFLLLCFDYHPETGTYGLVIVNVVRALGALTVVLLVGFIVFMVRRERARPLVVE